MRQGLILFANGILSINARTFRVALLDGLSKIIVISKGRGGDRGLMYDGILGKSPGT